MEAEELEELVREEKGKEKEVLRRSRWRSPISNILQFRHTDEESDTRHLRRVQHIC